jgi:hypothetical protein
MSNKVEIIINADGTRAIKALKDVGATATATGKANADAAKASALASKYEGDTISAESVKSVRAIQQKRTASAEYAKVMALVRKGSIDVATGETLAAAALQRSTAATLAATRASAAHLAAMGGEARGFARIRESLGGGISATGALASSIPGLAAFATAAGALGELKSAVTETLEFGEAMKRASEKTGLAVGTLSVLHYAAATTGGDFDSMSSAVAKMDKTIGAATEGNKKAQAFMHALGLDAVDLAGRSDGAEVAFKKFATTLAATENPIRRVELATSLLGKAGAEQIPTLIQLGTHWDELTQKTKDAGRYMDELSAEKLEQVNQKLKAMQEHIDGAKVSLAEGFTPALGKMIDVIEGGKGSLDSMNTLGRNLGKTFAFVAEVIYSAASAAEVLFAASELGGMTAAGRRDTAAASALKDKAQQMHDIAFGPDAPDQSTRFTGNLGKTGLVGMNGEVVGTGTGKPARSGEGFGGIDPTGVSSKEPKEKPLFDYEASDRENQQIHESLTQTWNELNKQDEESANIAADGRAKVAKVDADAAEAARRYADAMKNVEMAQSEAQLKIMEWQTANYGASAGNNAREMASLHRRQYQVGSDNIAGQVASVNGDSSLTDKQRDQELQRLAAEQQRLDHENQLQQMEDDKRIESTTLMGGLNDALREFTLEATNAGTMMKSMFSEGLGQTNSAIVKMLTEPASQTRGQHVFGQAGHDIFASASGTMLKGAEGSLMKGLGLGGGKHDGSSEAAALWVKMSGKGGKGSDTSMEQSDMAEALGGGKSDGSSSGGGLSKFISGLMGGGQGGSSASDSSGSSGSGSSGGGLSKFLTGMFGGKGGGADSSMEQSDMAEATGGGGSGMASMLATGASWLTKLIPGFAEGTDNYPTNSLIMVGEEGPEIMKTGGQGGSIIPNHALGGVNPTTHVNVDARGATDPAAVEEAGYRGAMRAAPQIHAAVLRSVADTKNRRPLNSH